MAALETLAIVAYRQPITGPEIQDLRGVSPAGVLKTLLERRLIRITGRKEVVGKPFLYATTREFLMHFGLREPGETCRRSRSSRKSSARAATAAERCRETAAPDREERIRQAGGGELEEAGSRGAAGSVGASWSRGERRAAAEDPGPRRRGLAAQGRGADPRAAG